MHSVFGWVSSNKNLRGRKGQQGFTLIELLVVVTILGILAAIVTLSLVGLTTHANVESCNSEYKTVQSALDSYMANKNLTTIPAQAGWTNDMTGGIGGGGASPAPTFGGSVALYNPAPDAANPNFTRNGTTQFWYTWDQFGRINGIASDHGGTGVSGCVPT
jgi:prepilin-type N-terminal cleavage/methylation domain-containing protein